MHRFKHRWIVVKETQTIASGNRFTYRSYEKPFQAYEAIDRLNKANPWFTYAYLVDRDKKSGTILP